MESFLFFQATNRYHDIDNLFSYKSQDQGYAAVRFHK